MTGLKTQRGLGWRSCVAAALLVSLCACSTGGGAFDSIRDDQGTADRERVYGSWEDLLGQGRTNADMGDAVDLIVGGDVVEVRSGRSYTWELDENGENERRIELPFDDTQAMIDTFHLAVEVTAVIAASDNRHSVGDRVQVGIALDPDVTLEDVKADFGDLEGAVFFLQDSPVFDYEDSVYGIVEDGALVAIPDEDGDLVFTLLEDHDAVQPPKGITLDSLRRMS